MIVSGNYVNSIPHRIKDALDRYAKEGCPTGDFLRAVLENNLHDAVGHAHSDSYAALAEICCYVYNDLPAACRGSPEIVRAWLKYHRDKSWGQRKIEAIRERRRDTGEDLATAIAWVETNILEFSQPGFQPYGGRS